MHKTFKMHWPNMVKSIDKLKWNSKNIYKQYKRSQWKRSKGTKKDKWWLKTNNKLLYHHKCNGLTTLIKR